jgi:acyl-CoA thioester hydrolase
MRRNEFQLRVNWGDTDKAGIVYYPNYFKWFDIAGHQFFRSIGLSPKDLEEKEKIIIPLLDVRCTFENPLYYDDVILIKTFVAEINNKTIKLNHEIFRGETRTGYGYEIRGWVKDNEGKLSACPIPNDIKDILKEDQPIKDNQLNPWLSA